MDGYGPLHFHKSRGIYKWFGLWIYGKSRVRIIDRSNWSDFLCLLRIVELDVAFQNWWPRSIICRLLLVELLLQLLDFFLIWWGYDTPAAPPWCSSSKSHAGPVRSRHLGSFHDYVDVVQGLALPSNQCTSVCFLQSCMLEHCKAYTCGPLY